jgi:hypothetical protein
MDLAFRRVQRLIPLAMGLMRKSSGGNSCGGPIIQARAIRKAK